MPMPQRTYIVRVSEVVAPENGSRHEQPALTKEITAPDAWWAVVHLAEKIEEEENS